MRMLLPLFLCAGLLGAQGPATSCRFEVPLPQPPDVRAWLRQEFDADFAGGAPSRLEVIVPPERLATFAARVPNAKLVERGRPYHEIASVLDAPDANYFTVAEIVQEMDQLVATYPTLATKVDLTTLPGAAKTHNGQSLWALKVSDAVASDEDEPAIVIAAQHHARELNSTFMVIGAMRRVLAGYATDPALQQVVDQHELYLVPCVNPDGVDHVWNVDNLWRKNRRPNGGGSYGVDLNRNYPFRWGACGASTSTGSETYRGPSAGSEPETRTMMAAQAALRPMLYLDFHSSGQEVLFSYSPCTTVQATLQAFLSRYADDLRAPMNYQTRAPSGSGESPEWHWSAGGTLAFLTEIGTSFQPAFTVTQTEEARVWPGIRRALTTWRPALQGHVRSIDGRAPLAATITFTPALFTRGETTLARARDGRYHLWLPLGTHQVTFTAPGHQPFTTPVTVSSYDTPQTLEVLLVPVWTDATLGKQGSDRVGTTTTFTYTSPGDAGATFWVALALGDTPGFRVGPRTVPLNADALLFASAVPGHVLVGNVGILPASAQANATFPIPPLPALAGIKLWAGGLTLDPNFVGSLKKFSPSLPFTLQP